MDLTPKDPYDNLTEEEKNNYALVGKDLYYKTMKNS